MAEVVKILVVTDGSGGFLNDRTFNTEFHLGEFLDVLQTTAWEGFSIQVTKAHRENRNAASIGADLVNFDFSTHNLSQYDEILLFPILRDDVPMAVPAGSPESPGGGAQGERRD